MNLETFVNKYIHFLNENKKILFIITTLFLLFLTFMATKIEINTSLNAFYYDDDPALLFNQKINAAFESKDSISLMLRIDENSEDFNRTLKLDETRVINYVNELKEKITKKSYIDSIITQNENPSLISEDKKTSLIISFIQFGNEEKYNKEKIKEIQKIIDETSKPAGVKINMGGPQILMSEIGKLILEDLIITGIITLIIVAIVVKIFLKYNNTTIFSTLVNFFTIMSIIGIMKILGMDISLATALIAALIIGLGVDYSLHVMNGLNNSKEKTKELHIKETFLEVSPSLFMSFITTFIGFASLFLAGSKMMFELGFVTCLGITLVFVLNHFYLPLLYLVFNKKEKIIDNTMLGNLIGKIEHKLPKTDILISKNPFKFIGVILIFTLIIISGITFLETKTNMSDFLPLDNQIAKDLITQKQIFEGTNNNLQIVVIVDNVFDPIFIKELDKITKEIKMIEHITETRALSDEIREMNGGALPDYKINFEKLPTSVSNDLRMTKIIIYYDTIALNNENTIINEIIPKIKEILPENYKLAGTTLMSVRQREIMKAGQMNTTLFSFVLILIILNWYFKSIIKSIIVLLPVLFAIIATQGLNGWSGIPFNQITAAVFGMIIGLGIDYGIHTITHMSKNLKKESPAQALQHTYTSLGKLLFVTSLTTILGFLSLQLASLSLLKDMGITLAFGIIMALLYSVILLPAIVIVEKDIENKIKEIIIKIKSIGI